MTEGGNLQMVIDESSIEMTGDPSMGMTMTTTSGMDPNLTMTVNNSGMGMNSGMMNMNMGMNSGMMDSNMMNMNSGMMDPSMMNMNSGMMDPNMMNMNSGMMQQ